MNDKMYLLTDLQLLKVELGKLLKKYRRLDVYGKVACEQMLQAYPAARGKKVFSCGEIFHSMHYILRHILPKSLLGSKHNYKTFMKSAHRIVYGNLHQCLSLSSVVRVSQNFQWSSTLIAYLQVISPLLCILTKVHGLKVSHITWLQNGVPSHSLRLSLLSRLVKWLLLYVQHIIHKVWHVAVSSSKELVYCDKRWWSELLKAEVKSLLSIGKFRIISDGSMDLQKIVNLGRTEFHIKKQGLRPITIFRYFLTQKIMNLSLL